MVMASVDSRSVQTKDDNVVLLDLQSVASRTETVHSSDSGDEGRSLWQNAKRYRRVVYVTFGLSSAILLYGYDFVIVGTISGMPEFQ
jgi:hypothetical protein